MSNDTNNLEEILDPYAASEAIPAINTYIASILQEVDRVIGSSGKGHVPDELCCELCDLRDEQRAALAEISKRYNIGETK
jgi:hypothetical protein